MANGKLAALAVLVILLHASMHCAAVLRPSRKVDGGGDGGMRAVMTENGFERGGSGGGPAECDGKFHSDKDLLVALPTASYAGGRRCFQKIRITSAQTGRTVEATVVDECECKGNIVDTSPAVWKALGLDTNIGEVPVTWSDA
ncbi:putative ripening-related protein 6 [Brachypodium distachyon]|uniref:RlpA-like protein double-psi beta-barrel domain-containing protein n=1 Tax=Brachypodium distachyon TaxID=15368 RepID=I1I4Y6_BRADI|nr:putative ripening-related protein 6 [Brachypodium distachyon]KQJ97230.1 hypothetical protein BRADI_3g29560v3 [Brachypodium distachyon]|eukprot:XP_003571923.1 putative ripening-related protein 6 [Brachypodium distachyon]